WHSLADDYLEAVKYRLQPDAILDSRETAQYCLYKVIITICKLIAPFCPHLSESIYLQLPKTEPAQSVHQSNWPIPERELLDERTIRDGETVVEAIATARRTKSEKGLALKSPIRKLLITAPKESLKVLQESQEAILRTLKAEAIELTALSSESPEGTSTLKVEIVA
ncbi:MAG: class I tRNA ligase family protein, partial [Thermoproteota archaeon]